MKPGDSMFHSEKFPKESCTEQWIAFKSGNTQAYASLYKNYFRILFKYGIKITPNRNLVLDAIQELFIELWAQRAQLSTPVSVKNYLFKALRRKLYRQVSAGNKTFTTSSIENYKSTETVSSKEHQIINQQLSAEQACELEKAVQQLTRRQREIVFLKFYEDLNYEEISKIMGIGIDAAYNVLSKAIRTLQKKTKKVVLYLLLYSFYAELF